MSEKKINLQQEADYLVHLISIDLNDTNLLEKRIRVREYLEKLIETYNDQIREEVRKSLKGGLGLYE